MAEDAKRNRVHCDICGKDRLVRYFWKRRDGTYPNICSHCMIQGVDVKKPETFLPILKELDRPFVETLWVEMVKKAYQKDPEGFTAQRALGTYLKSMALHKYHTYGFADSKKFADEAKKKQDEERRKKEARERNKLIADEANQRIEESVKRALEEPVPIKEEVEFDDVKQKKIAKSRLSEEKKKSLYNKTIQMKKPQESNNDNSVAQRPVSNASLMPHGIIDPSSMAINEQEILDNLSKREIQEMAIKWGENYAPSEWIKMEQMYQRYAQEFELNVDRDEALRNLCKTTIKLNQAIDAGDAATASKFATISDQLRKSGAFTEAQKKEEKKDYISSIGQLVSEVERIGGIIPRFDYKYEVEQDKVDLTLKDNQAYLLNLVKNEMGLGDLIESYIQKLDEASEQNKTTESLGADLNTTYMRDKDEEDEEYANNWINELEDSVARDESLEKFFTDNPAVGDD